MFHNLGVLMLNIDISSKQSSSHSLDVPSGISWFNNVEKLDRDSCKPWGRFLCSQTLLYISN